MASTLSALGGSITPDTKTGFYALDGKLSLSPCGGQGQGKSRSCLLPLSLPSHLPDS